MSDFNSSLPIRTEAAGDVAVKVVDATIPSNQLKVNDNGSVDVNVTADSKVQIWNGDNQLVINEDGSINASVDTTNLDIRSLEYSKDSVNVSGSTIDAVVTATDLDIRNLQFATDKIDVSGSTINAVLSATDLDIRPLVFENDKIDVSGSTVNVQSSDLDIRDLNHAYDSIKVANGDNFLAINADGSLNVKVSDVPAETALQDYNSATSIAAGASSTHSYTTSEDFGLEQVEASASGRMRIEIKVEGITKAVLFNSSANPNLSLSLKHPIVVKSGETITIIRTNLDLQPQDVYSTLNGFVLNLSGGTVGTGSVLSVNGLTGNVTLTKNNLGLSNVDNTSDLNKPISTATQTALNELGDRVFSAESELVDIDSQLSTMDGQITSLNSDMALKATLVYVDAQDAQSLLDAKAYIDAQIAALPVVDVSAKADKTYVDAQDAQNLVDAKAYTDAEIAAIPTVDVSAKADKTYVDAQDAQNLVDAKAYTDAEIAALAIPDVSALQTQIDDLDGYAQDLRTDLDDLDGYTQDIRSDLDLVVQHKFEKEQSTATLAQQSYTLLNLAEEKSIVLHKNREVLFAGQDYTLSTVANKTVITFAGDYAPAGVSQFSAGDKINVSYAYKL